MELSKDDKGRLKSVVPIAASWAARASHVGQTRGRIAQEAEQAAGRMLARQIEVNLALAGAFIAIPLFEADSSLLGIIARAHVLAPLTIDDAEMLEALSRVQSLTSDARASQGARRLFASGARRDAAGAAARHLIELVERGEAQEWPARLEALESALSPSTPIGIRSVLAQDVGFRSRVLAGNSAFVLSRGEIDGLLEASGVIARAIVEEGRFRAQAVTAGSAVRTAETAKAVNEMPIQRLRDATAERITVAPLETAGYKTVGHVLANQSRIASIAGIGGTTYRRIIGAARTIWTSALEEMPVRISIDAPTDQTHELLEAMRRWDRVRVVHASQATLSAAEAISPLVSAASTSVEMFLISGTTDDLFREAFEPIEDLASRLLSPQDSSSAWADFSSRPADYFAMLNQLGLTVDDDNAIAGDLSEDVVSAVRAQNLNGDYLSASLRGYQAFGARFALVQRRVVIGDEMGLGKTLEALAVLAHLHAQGDSWALVVCPAGLVTNWIRETQSKSRLNPHRVHGPGRSEALRNWQRRGGVAVTTFETLAWLEEHLEMARDLNCVVIDEAHYIKNPNAQRSRRARRIIRSAERAILLTGTPLENRVDEFRTLIGYVRPDLMVDATDLRPRLFRQQVAPAYLRRRTEQVLDELPDLVEIDEWVPMSPTDRSIYREAVQLGNFQAMRQAAMLHADSSKLERLLDIVEEARDNGRKVLVFSNYLSVLQEVNRTLGRDLVFGPLTGSVPARKRQGVVDQFEEADPGAVLISQIAVGGVGLNMQAASIVIICEPQLKPTSEWQAIARARRMGQLNTVQVHRLISEEGIDARIVELLKTKKRAFEDFATGSDTADAAPEALDVSEASLVREVIDSERRRLFERAPTDTDD